MKGATMHLYRTTMGVELKDFAARFGVDRRTVQRWENDTFSIPFDVAELVEEQWQAWLDRVEGFITTVEDGPAPSDAPVELIAYRDSERGAFNRALAVVLALSDRDVTAEWVIEEPPA